MHPPRLRTAPPRLEPICSDNAGMRSASPTPLANAGHSKALNVTCSSGAIGKCVRLGYKPWKRLPGVVRKRNVLRSSSMAYRPSIAEIPATTLPRPVAANPPESPPLSRTASARRCGGPSTRRQSMVSTYGFAVPRPPVRRAASDRRERGRRDRAALRRREHRRGARARGEPARELPPHLAARDRPAAGQLAVLRRGLRARRRESRAPARAAACSCATASRRSTSIGWS